MDFFFGFFGFFFWVFVFVFLAWLGQYATPPAASERMRATTRIRFCAEKEKLTKKQENKKKMMKKSKNIDKVIEEVSPKDYGIIMEEVWNLYGICMEASWNKYGIWYGISTESAWICME